MVRTFVRGGCLAAALFLLGCGGQPAPQPVAQNAPAANSDASKAPEVNPWVAALAEEAKAKAAAKLNPPPEMKLEPIVFPPDAPKGFHGKELSEKDPIPPEIQQDLAKWGSEGADKKFELLLHPHPLVRAGAAKELRYVAHKNLPGKVLALRGAMRDPNPKVRKAAAEGLGDGPEGKDALLELRALVRDPDPEVAGQAILALGSIGPQAAPALPELYAVLRRPEDPNLGWVLMSIGSMGPAAKEAAPHLVHTLDWWTSSGGEVLGKIGAEAELLEGMSSPSSKRVEHAASGARHLKNPSPAVAKRLMELASGGSDARDDAMEALGKIHPTTKEAASLFIRTLKDPSAGMRLTALEALEHSDPQFEEAVPALLAAVNDKDEYVRKSAIEALGKYPGAADVRLKVVFDEVLREGSVGGSSGGDALAKNAKEFRPLLAKIAADSKEDEARRGAAMFCLNSIAHSLSGDDRKAAYAELNSVVLPWLAADQPATVRAAAACILRENDVPQDDAMTAAWIAGIKGAKYLEARKTSIEKAADGKNEGVRDALIALLEEPDAPIHGDAARKLSKYGASAGAAIPRLIALVSNPKTYNRNDYYSAIGEIGARPDLSEPFLRKQVGDKEFYISLNAMRALGMVAAKNDLDATLVYAKAEGYLSDKKLYDKRGVVRALGSLGSKGGPAVPMILAFLKNTKDADDDDREAVVETLGAMGPAAKSAVPELLEMLEKGQEVGDVLEALTKIKNCGPGLARSAPKLFETVAIRRELLETFTALGPEAKDAAPAIADLLDSKDEYERRAALECLVKLGPHAAAAAPRLRKAVEEDPNDGVRGLAVDALLAIDPQDVRTLEAMIVLNSKRPEWQQDAFFEKLAKSPDSVTKALESERAAVRLAALSAVPKAFPDEKGLPIYEKALSDKDEAVRWAAAKRLVAAKRNAPGLVEALVGRLDDRDVRETVLSAGRSAVPLLAAVVLDEAKNSAQREGAVETLQNMPLSRRKRLELFSGGLRSKNDDVRFWSLAALGDDGDDLKAEATKIVMENLASKDSKRRQRALGIAGRFTQEGPAGEAAPPELIEAVLAVAEAADDPRMIHPLQTALGYNAKRPEARKTILKLASDPKRLRIAAALAGNLRGVQDPALPPLFAAGLKSSAEHEAAAFAAALSKQGPAGTAALFEALADPEVQPHVRRAVVGALINRFQPPKEDVAKVAAMLADPKSAPSAALVLQAWNYKETPLTEPLFAVLKNNQDFSYYVLRYLLRRVENGEKDVAALGPDLMEIASDPKHESRTSAFQLLAALARDDAQRAKLLDLIVAAKEPYERQAMAEALRGDEEGGSNAPSAMKVVAAALPGAKGERLERLLEVLGSLHPKKEESKEIVEILTPLAASADAEQQLAAARALARCGHVDAKLLDVLMKAAADENRNDRYEVFNLLQQLGPKAAPAVPKLVEMLDDGRTADPAIGVLGRIGPAASPAVPRLTAELGGYRFDTAIQALGEIGPGASEAVPALLTVLGRADRKRYPAAVALRKIRPEVLVETLRKELADPDRRLGALELLHTLDGAQTRLALPEVLKALETGDPEVQTGALRVVGRQAQSHEGYAGEEGEAVPPQPPLAKAEADRAARLVAPLVGAADPDAASAAAYALGELKSLPESSVPILIKALQHPKWRVKTSAAAALGEFETAGAQAVGPLSAWLEDRALRMAALQTLGRFGAASAPAVPAIVKIAKTVAPPSEDERHGSLHLQWSAIDTLGRIGPAAAAAVPELTKIYISKDEQLSRPAGEALWKIDPAAAEKAGVEPPKEKK